MTSKMRLDKSAHGLKTECLPFREVVAQSFAVIAPTTTPAANLGLIYALSGNGTLLSFLLGMLGLTFVCININQFASRSASPGSLYSYIAKGLGPKAGFICGWCLLLAYLVTGMTTLCGFAIFGDTLFGHLGIHFSPITLLAIGAGIAWYMAYKDIQLSATTMLVVEGISALLILILGLIIWAHRGFAIDLNQLTFQGATPGGVLSGLVLVIFGFSGFESAATLGDEAKNPLRTIPKAIISSTLLTGIFFLVTAYVEIEGFSGTSVSLANYEEPLTFLSQQAGVGWLGDIIAMSAFFSFFVCVLGSINPAARVFFMMSRHGLFHNFFGKAHSSNRTPHIAVTISALVVFLFPTLLTMFGLQLFPSMGYLGTLSTFGFIAVYVLISVAAPFYLYRLRKLRTIDVLFSVLGVFFMSIPILGLIGIPGNKLFPLPEYPYNVLPLVFFLYLIAGYAWFVFQRTRSPEMLRKMERRIEALHAKFTDLGEVIPSTIVNPNSKRYLRVDDNNKF